MGGGILQPNVLRAVVAGAVCRTGGSAINAALLAASAHHLYFPMGFVRPGNQACPLGVLHFRSWKLLFGEAIPGNIVVPNSARVKGLLTPESSGQLIRANTFRRREVKHPDFTHLPNGPI